MSWLLWSAALGNDNVELILVGWKGNDYRENEAIYWALMQFVRYNAQIVGIYNIGEIVEVL